MKMTEHADYRMFAPCGMNCMACYVHLKKKKPCDGCNGDDLNKPERCRSCSIKLCAAEKGLTHCFNCTDFPCKKISSLDSSYRKRYQVSLIENSLAVKDNGLEKFFRDEISRWTCNNCKGIISLHDKECTECGDHI